MISMLISFWGFSQEEASRFTLQEAINYALENNRKSKNASREISAAEKRKWETTASGLPQLNANIDYQNFLKQPISVIPAIFFGGQPGEFAEITFGTKQNTSATATLSQLLFDGSYLVGLQSAKVFLEISKNAKEKTDLEIRKGTINAYGNVLLANEQIAILQRNISVLEKNLFDITKIYENGLEEEESVEQIKLTLLGLESRLQNTIRLRDLAYKMFNLTIGKPIEAPSILTENLKTLTQQNVVLSLLEANENIENAIDYKIAFNDKTAKKLLVNLEKSKSLPSLNVFLNGGYSAFNEKFVFLNKDTKWFGSSLFGLNLKVPLFSSGMRKAATQRAKINLEIAEENLTEIEQTIKLEIAAAKSNYQFAIEDYNNKQKNLNLAERIEKKNQIKFFEGLGSSFDLRQAQTQLYASQNEILQAMLDVITKKAELETVLNEIPKN